MPVDDHADRVGVKKLPIALSLLAASAFMLAACDDGADDPDPMPTHSSVELPVTPSSSASMSPVPCVSASASPSDSVKNDKKGDGGVAYHPVARRIGRPNQPEPTSSYC